MIKQTGRKGHLPAVEDLHARGPSSGETAAATARLDDVGVIERETAPFQAVVVCGRNDELRAEVEGLVLTQNANMLSLMRSLGFRVRPFEEDRDFQLVSRSL